MISRNKRVLMAVLACLVVSAFSVMAVGAQTPQAPASYTVPDIDAAGVITSGFSWLTASIVTLMATMLAIKIAPRIVRAARRTFSSAAG
jgi:uncharacterized BrkB/YihY/UPF0761 family membrane protein